MEQQRADGREGQKRICVQGPKAVGWVNGSTNVSIPTMSIRQSRLSVQVTSEPPSPAMDGDIVCHVA